MRLLGAIFHAVQTHDATVLNAVVQSQGGDPKVSAACFRRYEACVVEQSKGVADNLDCAVELAGCVRKGVFGF
jgi:hypothetical protein